MNKALSDLSLRTQLSAVIGALGIVLCVIVTMLAAMDASAGTIGGVATLLMALIFLAALWLGTRAAVAIERLTWAANSMRSDSESDDVESQNGIPHLTASRDLRSASSAIHGMVDAFLNQKSKLRQQNKHLDQQARDRTRELTTMLDLTATLSNSAEQRLLIRDILSAVQRAVSFRSASIWMRERGHIALKSYFQPGDASARLALDDLQLSTSQSRMYKLIEQRRQPIVVNRVRRNLFEWLLSQLVDSYAASLYQGAQSWMALPLVAHDAMVGALHVDHVELEYFTPERQRLLVAIGQQAALALDHARLSAQAEQAAVMAERNRIARDLHDAVSQTLFAASVTAGTLESQIESNPGEARKQVAMLQKLNRGALAELRMLLFELRPDALRKASLAELLQHATDAAATQLGYPVNLKISSGQQPPGSVKTQLYRIAQEALNNATRHSGATQVDVDLACNADGLFTLAIRDNGRGFASEVRKPGHFGLDNMHERADEIGATINVVSLQDAGTTVSVTWQGAIARGDEVVAADGKLPATVEAAPTKASFA